MSLATYHVHSRPLSHGGRKPRDAAYKLLELVEDPAFITSISCVSRSLQSYNVLQCTTTYHQLSLALLAAFLRYKDTSGLETEKGRGLLTSIIIL